MMSFAILGGIYAAIGWQIARDVTFTDQEDLDRWGITWAAHLGIFLLWPLALLGVFGGQGGES